MQHPMHCAAHRVLSFSLVAQGACALNGAMHALPIRIFLPRKNPSTIHFYPYLVVF